MGQASDVGFRLESCKHLSVGLSFNTVVSEALFNHHTEHQGRDCDELSPLLDILLDALLNSELLKPEELFALDICFLFELS